MQSYIFFTFILHISKKYYYLCTAKISSGCSSARLEYTSGGRVVASSNLVIPTMLSKQRSQSKDWDLFLLPIPMVLAAYWGLLGKIVHCISDSYKAELEKEKDKSCDLSSLVGLHIEISNRLICDIETVIWYMNWINAKYITV